MNRDLIKKLHDEWRAVVHTLSAKMKPILQAQDLTKVDGIVMMTVKKNKARTKAELAERLHFEPASLTRSLNRLVQRGLVQRYSDPADKRCVHIELTQDGKNLTQTLEKAMLTIWKTAFKGAAQPDITTFIKLLQNARHNLLTQS